MKRLINNVLKSIALYMCKREQIDIAIRAYTNDKRVAAFMRKHCKTVQQVNDHIRDREMSIMGYDYE